MVNRIRELRAEKNISQAQLAHEIGVTPNAIGKYERGDREPKLERWQKLADYFEVSVGYLQGIEDKYTGVMADSERQARRDKIKEKMTKTLRKAWVGDDSWEDIYADFKRQWNLLELEFQKITQDMEE